MGADFSGWATKAGLVCSDGRTIGENAFMHNDGQRVPLVWNHQRNDPENILGYAILKNQEGGVRAYGYFNDTPRAQVVKQQLIHGDISYLSIFANKLIERNKFVHSGDIKEVSLVPAGANPGAMIDEVMAHSEDGFVEVVPDAAIIFTGLELEHADGDSTEDSDGEETGQDVMDTPPDQQKKGVSYVIEQGLESQATETESKDESASAEHSDAEHPADGDGENNVQHSKEGNVMTRNVFQEAEAGATTPGNLAKGAQQTLTHSQIREIAASAIEVGSMRRAVEGYALQHGIDDIELLFPDAKTITDRPEFIKRRTEWVAGVLNSVSRSPFSRIKTIFADITEDAARAKGYIKGSFKKEEFFKLLQRVTTPTTVYKKQKLDRDDIVDITSFDVVAWLKYEIRLMLEEEIARAILIGDGRSTLDPDKIKDPVGSSEGAGIRSILHDHELYAPTITVNIDDANSNMTELADAIIRAKKNYKGTGQPKFYTTQDVITDFLVTRDSLGRKLWRTEQELAAELGVSELVPVEVMEEEPDLVGILVNLTDYRIGADRGGEISFFDDFDIDYNQNKYLMETRVSGALTKLKSAINVKKSAAASVLVEPTVPSFDEQTGVVTIPTKTGVVYKNASTGATLTAGEQSALAAGATLNVLAVPSAGYYFADNLHDEWSFTRPAA